MLHIVLVEPEIPQNTGNISRTCAATGSKLHLIRPLGFEITERRVRRAGLDYWPLLELEIHDSLDELFRLYPEAAENLWLTTTKAQRSYAEADYRGECWLFFGKETAPVVSSGARRSVCPYPHALRGAQPQPLQRGRHRRL